MSVLNESRVRAGLGLAALMTLLIACEDDEFAPPDFDLGFDGGAIPSVDGGLSPADGGDVDANDGEAPDANDGEAPDANDGGDASAPEPGVTITPASSAQAPLTTTEHGGTATFTVVLQTRPTSNVVIPLASTRPTEGTVAATALTFTPDDWATPQTVTVTGQADGIVDGDQDYAIDLGPVTSDDPAYAGIAIPSVSLKNLDVDGTKFLVTPGPTNQTTEIGGTVTFTVRLTAPPTAPVTLGLASSLPSEGTPSVTSLTFDATDWDTEKTVTVTGQNDDVDDDDQAYVITFAPAVSDDPRYAGTKPDDIALVNVDDDSAALLVTGPTPNARTSESGGAVTVSFRLASRPTADVTFPLSVSNVAEADVSASSITFTPDDWSTPKSVTVTGKDDGVNDPSVAYSLVIGPGTSADGKYAGLDPPDVALTNVSKCGDGIVETYEQCDDANDAKCDGCESCELRRAVKLTHLSEGGASYIEGPTATAALQGSMCVELWARLTADAEIVTAYTSTIDGLFLLRCQGGQAQFVAQNAPSGIVSASGPVTCADGVFHHFAGCREVVGTTVTHRVFVDGALVAEATGTTANVGSASAQIVVGGALFVTNPSGLPGTVDELRISTVDRYKSSFVPARRFTSDANTYLLWHMDEPDTTTTIVDASGNGRDGTIQGANATRVTDTGYQPAMCQ